MTKDKTTTIIAAENGQVVIRHSMPVGTQWLTPEQAREFANTLHDMANAAEHQARRMTN